MVACGTSHGIPAYHMVQMDKWDCLTPDGGMWDIPWDSSVPHGSDGMGWTSGTALTPDGGIWDIPWDSSVSHGTDGMEVHCLHMRAIIMERSHEFPYAVMAFHLFSVSLDGGLVQDVSKFIVSIYQLQGQYHSVLPSHKSCATEWEVTNHRQILRVS